MTTIKEKSSADYFLISIVLILLGCGLIAVYSSSAIYAFDKYGSSTYFLIRQFIWTLIGISAAIFFIHYDHRNLKSWAKPVLGACLILLVYVLIFGKEISGAKRWIRIGGLGFQPSELTKLALIFFVAYYCDKKRSRIENFMKGLLPLLLVLLFFCGLIYLQPDFGTPVLIFVTCVTMIFIGGGKWSQLLALGLAAAPAGFLAVWMVPYRRERMLSFLDPWQDTHNSSYQLIQSFLAMGSGGLSGAGLGNSHSKLLYLPEPHTDFIFPIFAEEFGLMGSWFILLMFGLIAWSGFRIASQTTNLYSTLVASGITLMITYQAIFNIAVVTGCMPTKGIPLPFLSFGGSSMVVILAGIGILLNISRQAQIR